MDGMHLADMHVAPIPLQRLVHPRSVAARAGEDVVDADTARQTARTWVRRPAARSANDTSLLRRHVIDPVCVGQQLLAAALMSAGLSDGVHDVRVILDRGPGGADTLPLIVQVGGQRSLGDADGGREIPSGTLSTTASDTAARHAGFALAVPSITFVASMVR